MATFLKKTVVKTADNNVSFIGESFLVFSYFSYRNSKKKI